MASKKSKNLLSIRKIKKVAEPVIKKLRDSDIRVEVCGGIRRGELEDKQAVLVVSSINWTWYIVDHNFDASDVEWNGRGIVDLRFTIEGVPFKVTSAPGSAWGAEILFATGTVGFVKTMVAHARCLGCALRHDGLFMGDTIIAGVNEKQIFEALGFPFIEPERRFPQKPYSKMFKGAPVKIC